MKRASLLTLAGLCLSLGACVEEQRVSASAPDRQVSSEQGGLPTSGWRVSFHLTENSNGCSVGGRGRMEVTGNVLSYFAQGMSYPNWQVALEPDGSADKTVGEYVYPTRKERVKVAAGTGGRKVNTRSEYTLCGYTFIPD
jgi:hypothetical protein